jgi:hypothetical protein
VTLIAIVSTPNNIRSSFPTCLRTQCETDGFPRRTNKQRDQENASVGLQGLMATHVAFPLKRHGYTDDPVNRRFVRNQPCTHPDCANIKCSLRQDRMTWTVTSSCPATLMESMFPSTTQVSRSRRSTGPHVCTPSTGERRYSEDVRQLRGASQQDI